MKFLIGKWIQAIVKRAIHAGIAVIGVEQLATWGVTLNPELLTVSVFVGLEAVRGYLKHKVGLTWL